MAEPTQIVDSVEHRIGTCPACRGPIVATVTVRTTVRAATITTAGDCRAHTTSRPIAVHVDHTCSTEEPS